MNEQVNNDIHRLYNRVKVVVTFVSRYIRSSLGCYNSIGF